VYLFFTDGGDFNNSIIFTDIPVYSKTFGIKYRHTGKSAKRLVSSVGRQGIHTDFLYGHHLENCSFEDQK
jgi:hypothetical protein